MASPRATVELKNTVREFWNADPCGSRYVSVDDAYLDHARVRRALEPHIQEFADFASAHGKRVLEIGVGMGADYLEWLRAGALATGIDLSCTSIDQARRRCELAGFVPDLRLGDAEHLAFADDSFDFVYSYGVMHHSPNTEQCLREAWRVLKPGGQLKVMLYHHPSWTGLMLWLRYGILRGKTLRETVYEFLESPGTKCFTRDEVEHMLMEFGQVHVRQVFSPGDLLLHRPSGRFQGPAFQLARMLYPRALVRVLGKRYGLFLLVTARKVRPAAYEARVRSS
jgi:ubiquinone/menaquinone biosynthesis C-methylase UbiE